MTGMQIMRAAVTGDVLPDAELGEWQQRQAETEAMLDERDRVEREGPPLRPPVPVVRRQPKRARPRSRR